MSYAHMAEHVRSKGRGSDTMLIHMTPREVGGLQALAKASGGSLTINPDTGLPEAGWLGDLLPTLVGAALTATGIGAPLAAGLTGLGTGVITGDLNKGLMAGLQAFGGASAAGALGAGAGATAAGNAAANVGATTAANTASTAMAPELAAQLSQAAAGNIVPTAATNAAGALSQGALNTAMGGGASALAAPTLASALPAGLPALAPPAAAPGILSRFGAAARGSLPAGLPSSAAPYAAGYGLLSAIGEATTPSLRTPEDTEDNFKYEGPYTFEPRVVNFPKNRSPEDSSEWNYFPTRQRVRNLAGELTGYADGGQVSQFPAGIMPQPPGPLSQFNFGNSYYSPSNNMATMSIADVMGGPQQPQTAQTASMPQPTNPAQPTMQNPAQPQMRGFLPPTSPSPQQSSYPAPGSRNFGGIRGLPALAKGGSVPLKDGSFIVDARTVSELGNGSSNAGQEVLARHGGRPIKGPGDGVSDSIKANIGGRMPARVARDEVEFSPEAVARLGGGDHRKGTKRLYDLMERAHKARKRANRGQDTNVRAAVR
jgi:hypothetical protein